ncbi:MAG: hypothetical protein SF187_02100 [Deltaproteobacteria bacterium]|nr:hypothetical protein [Deltaproteobacteria bacterium]
MAALLAVLSVGVLASSHATAQPALCSALPNPVFIQVGSTLLPLLRQMARKLRDSTLDPMTVVFTDGRSCAMIDAIRSGTPLVGNLSYAPSTAEDPTWTPDRPLVTCTTGPGGVPLQMIHSDVFVESCTSEPLPPGIGVFTGPVLPFVFVTSPGSSQQAITAEEAYFAFGFGQVGSAAPWVDESFLFARPNTSGTKITFGANIGVPANRWKGAQLEKTTDVVNAVAASVSPEATLGIVGGSDYDGNRDKLKALAFRAFGQRYAFFPDSTPSAFDKRNVRDGHYLIWAPAVFLVAGADAAGVPAEPRIARLRAILRSEVPIPEAGFEATRMMVEGGFVPECAMGVKRTGQAGRLQLNRPGRPCGCFFEKVTGGSPSCAACTDDSMCEGGICNLGFCEANPQ